MRSGELKIDARRKQIMAFLEAEKKVFVAPLSKALGVTAVTIRNDLDALARNGELERIQGGAVLKTKSATQTQSSGQPVRQLAEKQRMALAVASQIHDGDTILCNGGTTTLEIVRALTERRNLNIVTNSTAIAAELSCVSSFRVILLGGEFNPNYGFTYGGDAQDQLRKYQADYAILSVDGVSADCITTYHAEEAILDRMMMDQSRQTIVAADHTKMGRTGFSKIFGVERVQTLVTDDLCDKELLQTLRQAGLDVILA